MLPTTISIDVLEDEIGSAQKLEWDCENNSPTERLCEAMRQTGYSGLRRVKVTVRDYVVSLEGQVESYHMKQLAQEVVRRVYLEAIIRNAVEVIY